MRLWASLVVVLGLAPGAASAETLAEALASAYRANPTLEAARADAKSGDEAKWQARASLLPRIDAIGTYGSRRVSQREPSATAQPSSTIEPRSYGVEGAIDVFTGGRRFEELKQARATGVRGRENLRAVEQAVLLAAIAAYVDMRRDQEVVRISEHNLQVLTRQRQAARDRFEVGEITRTDVAQAEARLAAADAQLAGAHADLEASRANYVRVIGMSPGDLAPVPPLPALPATLEEATASALEANPDLGVFRAAEKIAHAQVGVERAGLLPSVSAVASLDREYEFQNGVKEQDVAVAAAQLRVPLFEGGYYWSRVRQAGADHRRAKAQTEQVRRQVISDVASAWNDHLASKRVIEASLEQRRAANLALEGAEQELEVGLRTTLDVLDAQQEALNAQLAVVRAERDSYVAAHILLQSMGALDARALDINAPLYSPEKSRFIDRK